MGTVYKVWDKTLKRVVVLKTLSRASHPARAAVRFQNEARVLNRLNHGGIASLWEFGLNNDQPYLVLEFIEGKSLAELLKECRDNHAAAAARRLDLPQL